MSHRGNALSVWRGSAAMAQVGFQNIAAGIIGGLLAAVFGSSIGWDFVSS